MRLFEHCWGAVISCFFPGKPRAKHVSQTTHFGWAPHPVLRQTCLWQTHGTCQCPTSLFWAGACPGHKGRSRLLILPRPAWRDRRPEGTQSARAPLNGFCFSLGVLGFNARFWKNLACVQVYLLTNHRAPILRSLNGNPTMSISVQPVLQRGSKARADELCTNTVNTMFPMQLPRKQGTRGSFL